MEAKIAEAVLRMKMVAGVAILAVYATLTALNMSVSFDPLLETVAGYTGSEKDLSGLPKAVEKLADERIYGKEHIINIYSFIHVLLGKNEENNFEVVKDLGGSGHFTWFQNNLWLDPMIFKRVRALKNNLPEKTRLIAMLPLEKNVRGYTKFARGLPDNRINELSDVYKANLQKMGIDSLDLRKLWESSGIEYENLFYKSDHHWRVETAFWGFTELAKFMRDTHAFPVDPFYLDEDNYNGVTYKNSFVGAMLQKTGFPFLEPDDLTLLYPKFSTDYLFSIIRNEREAPVTMRGRFERIFYQPYENKANKYLYYEYNSTLWGIQPLRRIQNMNKPDAPRVLFINDSFAWPVIAFFSALCSDVWVIDPRIYYDGYSKIIKEIKPDYVFLLVGVRAELFTEAMGN
jgi:hypothetical protein